MTSRPSVDPELMMRMLLVGYIMGIRSERRLCDEVHLNLAYRWFCKLDLTDPILDHSTFSKNRHGRFRDSDMLRHVFEAVVAQCIDAGLASGQRYAADASIIAADANRQNSTPKADWNPEVIDPVDAPRAVREYLETLDDAAFGAASPVVPKFISHSDPASQWTGARGGPAYFAYSTNDQKRLRQHGFKASMSGKGNCYDNAVVEAFFKTITYDDCYAFTYRAAQGRTDLAASVAYSSRC